jgi:sodium-dependent dicarboxylate transporter 2/3/5
MVAVFAYATVVLSNIMSNTATVAILVPAASLLSGADPVILPLVVGLCASCALFLPVSTPPNAIAFSTGYVEQKDFRFAGLIVGIGGPILIMLWVYLLR